MRNRIIIIFSAVSDNTNGLNVFIYGNRNHGRGYFFRHFAFVSSGGSWGRVQGVRTPNPPPPEMTCCFLIQLVFCKKKTVWFIGVEVEQETSAPPPKKNPGSAPGDFVSDQFVISKKPNDLAFF